MAASYQRSLAGGEITPALHARADQAKFLTGLKTMRNFTIQKHGGARNRAGLQFICEVSDSSASTRLHKFVFNATQTYVLEFGDQYMRVIRNGVQQKLAAQNITAITATNPVVVTITGHGYSNGDEVFIDSVGGMTELNNRNFKVAGVTANTFQLYEMDGITSLDGTGFTAYTSGGTAEKVYEITTPYVEADLRTLQFVQSADIITIVHPNYAVRELSRTGHTNWTLATVNFQPSLDPPTSPSATNGVAGSTVWRYKVTSVKSESFEESLPTAEFSCTGGTPTAANPNLLSWTADPDALEYNIYREFVPGNGIFGLIGATDKVSNVADPYLEPNPNITPPMARTPFNAASDYPSAVTYFQQRLCFANTDNNPEKCWMSRSGNYHNLTISSPLQADDAVTFTIAGRQVNEIKHMIEVNGKLMLLTSGGEWLAKGDVDGVIYPYAINLEQQAYSGASDVAPVGIGNAAVYVQARGSIMRDLGFDNESNGYVGKDLTSYATHLFEKYTVVAMDYQQVPNSIVWAVRSDGTLLGLTYVREHEIWGWHRHDTGVDTVDSFEDVVCVPEGAEDFVYVIVKRTVNGATKRYIERMYSRSISTSITDDSRFLDSHLTYDGRNTGSTSMTLSGGTAWTYDETLTLTASAAYFAATDVGNDIVLNIGTDTVTLTITGYSSTTVVTGRCNKTVPAALRATATTDWSKAVDVLTGLWHLEGRTLRICADGNAEEGDLVVSGGELQMVGKYSVVHAGLQILADLVTLRLANAKYSIGHLAKRVVAVDVMVYESRGFFAGPDATELAEATPNFTGWGTQEPFTGRGRIAIAASWDAFGELMIRQSYPLPLEVLAMIPIYETGDE